MQLNRINNRVNRAVVVFGLCLLMTSCKKKFTDPPPLGSPDIVANTTIRDLKARYTVLGTTLAITDDAVIGGVVSCDDKSGNFYQQIAIQDSTGGLLLRIAGNNLYNNYPVGRKIFVKCKGLYLGDYGRMIQIGGGVDVVNGGVTLLAVNLQDEHIIKGGLNQPIVPLVVTVAQLTTNSQDPYINTVVKLQNFQFNSAELTKNYADDGASGNRIIESCTSPATNKITLRTSNYSNFATIPVAQGNGEIIGVYSIFNSTKQFTIRDTTDVRFYNPRCGGSGSSGSINLGTTSPFLLDFNNIGSGLPLGVYVKQDATATAVGNDGTIYNGTLSGKTSWSQTSLGFKNFASATGLTATSTSTEQDASANRALGFRQTGTVSTGGDPGAAFAFQLANTTGKSNLQFAFQLQSLDGSTTGRTTTWRVDYGIGSNPPSFTTVTTNPASLTTVIGTFANTLVTVNFGSTLNNISQPVWIRVVTLTGTSGSGSRPSTAVDDVKFSWN